MLDAVSFVMLSLLLNVYTQFNLSSKPKKTFNSQYSQAFLLLQSYHECIVNVFYGANAPWLRGDH